MTSPADLCNLALDQISARTSITGINPASPPNNVAAQVASRTYQQQVDAVFRAANWNSARKQADLTLLKAAWGTPENPDGTLPQPPLPWLYEYGYPADCLKIRFVVPKPNLPSPGQPALMTSIGVNYITLVNTALPFVPAIDTDTNGNQIKVVLTNACRAQAVYTARIDNPDLWDSGLQNAVIGALAAWFASPITGDDKKMTLRVQLAAALIKEARIQDGNESITNTNSIPDWMNIRDYGGGYGAWGAGGVGIGNVAGWDSWTGPDGIAY